MADDGFERVVGFEDEPPPYSDASPGNEAKKQREKVGFQQQYLRSVPGLLKVLQIIVSLLGFIATLLGSWVGSGFVSWVTISAFLTTSILFVVHAFNVYRKLPGFWPLYELLYLVLYTLKYFVSAIICIAGITHSGVAIFGLIMCLLGLAAYGLDCYMQYKRYKEAREEMDRQRESGEGSADRRGESFCVIF